MMGGTIAARASTTPSDIVLDERGTPAGQSWTGSLATLGSDFKAIQHHQDKSRLRFEIVGEQVVIHGTDRVGVIVLPSGRRVILRTKISGIKLIEWLGYVGEFPEMQSWSSKGSVVENDSWQKALGRLFLTELDQVTRFHLRKGFVRTEISATSIRGRVDWSKAATKPWLLPKLDQVVRIRRFETPANQMLATALQRLVLFQSELDPTDSFELARLRREWASICKPAMDRHTAIQASLLAPPDGYRHALQLAVLLLKGASIDQEAGSGGEAFTLSLSSLWETALKQMCRELTSSTGWRVASGSNGIRRWDDANETDDSYRCMRTDTLLSSGGQRWVLDAKYKRDFGDESRNDRFQMCAYAIGFRASRATLVYPSSESKAQNPRLLLRERVGDSELIIDSISLPMDKGPAACRKELLSITPQAAS